MSNGTSMFRDPVIHNCHAHVFPIDAVPNHFLPPAVFWLLRWPLFRRTALMLMKHADPYDSRDRVQRLANLIRVTMGKSQEEIFDQLAGYYPENTVFVLLPMDMHFMDRGNVSLSLDEQHEALYSLSQKYPGKIIPFAAIDPRRENILSMLRQLVEEKGFRGIKIYPPLGYYPYEPELMELYNYASDKGLAVMAHCSKGGVSQRGISKFDICRFAHPSNYERILDQFPELKICLAHCGGDKEWHEYLSNPSCRSQKENWVSIILDMLRNEHYANIYADISYTIYSSLEFVDILNVLLQHPAVSTKILFGSDYFLVENALIDEKKYSMLLRSKIGETLFRQITETNPKKYLGLSSSKAQ